MSGKKFVGLCASVVGLGVGAGFLLGETGQSEAAKHSFPEEVTAQADAGIDGKRLSTAWLPELVRIEPDNVSGLQRAAGTLAEQLGGNNPRNLAIAYCAIAGLNDKLAFGPKEPAPARRAVRTAATNFSFLDNTPVPESLQANCYAIDRQALTEPGKLLIPYNHSVPAAGPAA